MQDGAYPFFVSQEEDIGLVVEQEEEEEEDGGGSGQRECCFCSRRF